MQAVTLASLLVLLPRLAMVSGSSIMFNVSSEATTTDVSEASRSIPVSLLPLALALAGPAFAVALGTLKPVLLALGLLYLALFGLTYVPVVGELLQASFRTFGAIVTDSVSPDMGRDLLRVVGLDTEACRTRAVCEITEEAVRKYPTVAAMLRSLTGAVQAHGNNESVLKGLLGGLSGLGCESLYSTCSQSPIGRFLEHTS
ncbi:uncharacterized protein LOC119394219 [Rhipicephalus sanguineus]|uniref:uncharacterized protein LOC119394219 n=1 Tax=Rhipicephalus sanguineus TaxID=34632 RepID=UPI0018954F06|nr:uncharacterized protein LOC119394219 [Rhipicephalus sanguineus]XP_049271668.1 uncharacterized protein LOC119394219 [Rhipicephalus sanguineus]XP_049271669.1 uncharacterized protein LOC119394219 [Rhipicephalus sanguineus]